MSDRNEKTRSRARPSSTSAWTQKRLERSWAAGRTLTLTAVTAILTIGGLGMTSVAASSRSPAMLSGRSGSPNGVSVNSITEAPEAVTQHEDPPSTVPHIMLIVEENKAYDSAYTPFIIGNPSAPYINGLAKKYTSATHWFANQHGSPDDYLDLISGSNQGLGVGTKPPYTAPTLVDELNSAQISWKAYMESMPSPCYHGGTTGLYESDHNPFVYFSDYKSLCSGDNGVVPYSLSQVSTDLNSTSPPDFVWITPNLCHDMHTNGGSCGSNGVADGDVWLSKNLPTVLSSSWFTNGGIIIITWDESDVPDTSGGSYGDGGHVATLVIASNAHGAFTASGDHYATLRGIEQAYGIGLLGNSAKRSFGDLRPAF